MSVGFQVLFLEFGVLVKGMSAIELRVSLITRDLDVFRHSYGIRALN